jgi:branched-chain amino acid aminotransferase
MLQQFNEANRDIVVNINGNLVHRDEAGISPFDSAVQGGDAVWEGLRLYDGKIFRLTQHLERLLDSARALAFAEVPEMVAIKEEISRTVKANKMIDGVHLRLTLTRGVKTTSGMDPRLNQSGPTLIVLAEHKAPVYGSEGITLITSAYRRIPADCMDQKIHSCNLIPSILAKIQANAAGVDDALMLDMNGFVAETNATHVFIVEDDTISTSRTVACPEGITRAAVLELCELNHIEALERDITLAEIHRADEVFCTGTMGEIVPVKEIDGRVISDGERGPVTQLISEMFDELVAGEGDQVG